jgi:hypothetical protein
MEWLLDNPIASMYGPYFLAVYVVSAVLGLLFYLGYKKYVFDKQNENSIPPIPARPDIYEMASLSGALDKLLETTLAELLLKKVLVINSDKEMDVNPEEFNAELNPIEETLVAAVAVAIAEAVVVAVAAVAGAAAEIKKSGAYAPLQILPVKVLTESLKKIRINKILRDSRFSRFRLLFFFG